MNPNLYRVPALLVMVTAAFAAAPSATATTCNIDDLVCATSIAQPTVSCSSLGFGVVQCTGVGTAGGNGFSPLKLNGHMASGNAVCVGCGQVCGSPTNGACTVFVTPTAFCAWPLLQANGCTDSHSYTLGTDSGFSASYYVKVTNTACAVIDIPLSQIITGSIPVLDGLLSVCEDAQQSTYDHR
jgi:hypothetical protein